jgi:hypothetical protein
MLCDDDPPLPRTGDAGALGTTISITPDVSMLAATALGFAVSSGPTDANVRRLRTLAESEPDVLVQACAAVRHMLVAADPDRMTAIELLDRAARSCIERGPSLAGARSGDRVG